MDYAYPVHYGPDSGSPHIWVARIPGLDGTEEGPETCGDDPEDIRAMATGLIDAWIGHLLSRGEAIPTPGPLPKGEGWELARTSLRVRCALMLRALRAQAGWSQAETARRMGIKQPQYAKLEDPSKANPRVSTLDRLANPFGVRLTLETLDKAV